MRLSKRTNWQCGENDLAVAVRERRQRGGQLLDLTVSNPFRAGLPVLESRRLGVLAAPAVLSYDPDPRGMLSARQAVADYYHSRRLRVPVERLCLTASTSEAYSFLFRLLADPGDRVLVPAPSYPLFDFLADINDVELVPYVLRLQEGVWGINFESLEQAIDERVRAVILVSPNNPTGSCLHRGELGQLNLLCAAHNLAIISDEVFMDYLMPGFEHT